MSGNRTILMHSWVVIVGAIFGAVTLLFLMGLVLLSFDKPVPCVMVN